MILVRHETTPDDIHGMAAAQGILTSGAARPAMQRSWRGVWESRRSPVPATLEVDEGSGEIRVGLDRGHRR